MEIYTTENFKIIRNMEKVPIKNNTTGIYIHQMQNFRYEGLFGNNSLNGFGIQYYSKNS